MIRTSKSLCRRRAASLLVGRIRARASGMRSKIERVVSPGRHRSLAGARALAAADRLELRVPRRRQRGSRAQARHRPTWSRRCSMKARASSTPRRSSGELEETAVELRFSVDRDQFHGSIRMLRERQDESLDLAAAGAQRSRASTPTRSTACARKSWPGCGARPPIRARSPAAPGGARHSPNHPYARPNNGTLNSVPTITAEDLQGLCPARVHARDT